MVYERNYEYLAERLIQRLNATELEQVARAYEVAEAAHAGQVRDEGTPYILHPIRVAVSLVDELDVYSPKLICSALMHDVIEDSPTTREEIAAMFDEEIAEIVWLLTKLESVTLPNYLAAIEAAAHTGAPIVKLCDRLDNLRFLTQSPKVEKIIRYIRTTEIFYIPMAARTNAYLHEQLRRWLDEARRHVKAVNR
ncbi:MAG TPA: HD domain-containing protein [Blastocatellia bacterium]|nr:HD domain-containing protein [Blastocatellia bacterium]